MTLRLGLVGLGKIARTQHLPAIAATEGVELAAVADPHAGLPGVPCYPDIAAMLEAEPGLDAVTLCTPPQGRFDLVRAALAAGRHVMLEKPPCASLAEAMALRGLADAAGLTLYAAWHSRAAAAVAPARAMLAGLRVRAAAILWKEDVRRWHPGQDWIWAPGGLGVFDPGINALSIATRILPEPFFLRGAELHFPANRQAPIAAELVFAGAGGLSVTAVFDWRETGSQVWDIRIETDAGVLVLSQGGARLALDGRILVAGEDREYRGLYAQFAALIGAGRSETDLSPLVHVADAFLLGRRHLTEPF